MCKGSKVNHILKQNRFHNISCCLAKQALAGCIKYQKEDDKKSEGNQKEISLAKIGKNFPTSADERTHPDQKWNVTTRI